MLKWLQKMLSPARPPDSAALHSIAAESEQGTDTAFEATGGRVAFNDGHRQWEESFDCVASLLEALHRNGRQVRAADKMVVDEETGLCFRPVLIEFQPTDKQGVRKCTKIHVTHPTAIPDSVFEYQHATGDSMSESIEGGYDAWSKADFLALSDATRSKPVDCTVMLLDWPARDGRPARKRRVVLGPISHFRQRPIDATEGHPFCPCCLFTTSIDTFKSLIESRDGFSALRLFAMRDADGVASSDCRINGEECEPGKAALRRYASTWPNAGVEFRKQYVIVQDAP